MPIWIQWYFVADGTPNFPYPSLFGSRNWETEREWLTGPGEVYLAPRPWVDGHRVRGFPRGTIVGTPDQWANGIVIGTPCIPFVGPGAIQGTVGNFAGDLAPALVLATARLEGRTRVWPEARGHLLARAEIEALTGSRAASRPDILAMAGAAGSTEAEATDKASVSATAKAAAATHSTLAVAPALLALAEATAITHQGRSYGEAVQANARAAEATSAAGQIDSFSRVNASAAAAIHATGQASGSPRSTAGAKAVTTSTGKASPSARVTGTPTEAINATGKASPSGRGSAGATAVTASFQTVTPPGACGTLPASIVARFSGGTGSLASLNGVKETLTYNSVTHQWSAMDTIGGNIWGFAMQCNAGNWGISGNTATVGFSGTLTGTSGPNPSLSGSFSQSFGATGHINVAVTRT